ncbi:MAG: hypothetical protein U5N27_04330 [Rhizobium sp.]|nr:hypothetical protein [Rhizobium sp.]
MKVDAKTSFQRKLTELEKIVEQVKNGIQPAEPYPKNVKEFRAWKRNGLFDDWVSKSVDAPNGAYPEMARKLRGLLDELELHSTGHLRKTIRQLNHLIEALTKQNVELECTVRALSDKLDVSGNLDKADRSKIISLYR